MATRTRGKLTQAKIAKLNRVGRFSDGQGRYLQVSCINGRISKSWTFNTSHRRRTLRDHASTARANRSLG
jgi:hypothetical protein